MAESREARATAAEIKFVIDSVTGARVREWARANMAPDPYGTGPSADEYKTSSLYFDTDDLDVFHRRASYGRAKYRVRRYSTADYVFLERKLRQPRLVLKRRTRADAGLLDPHAHPELLTGPGRWFFDRLAVRRLRPACVIAYQRTARNMASDSGPLRLTLDEHIRVAPAQGFLFETVRGEPVLKDRTVLELKFRGLLPAVFKRLVETFLLEPKAASKYRLGMTALGHEPGAYEPSREQPEIVSD
jgi:hypothetical protein